MENTLENKAKFFAQYWGQKIGTYKLTYSWRREQESEKSINGYITLKRLSSITDEDAIEIAKIKYHIIHTVNKGKEITKFIMDREKIVVNHNQTIEIIDYLRSKGYALPWMSLSVEELVNRGWIKLI